MRKVVLNISPIRFFNKNYIFISHCISISQVQITISHNGIIIELEPEEEQRFLL